MCMPLLEYGRFGILEDSYYPDWRKLSSAHSSPRPSAKPLATCVSSSAALRQKLGDGGTARLAHE